MPFTPFHFGVGIAAKAVFLRRFSLGLFVALQIVIDLESLYNLVYRRYPVHRFLHTFVGATLLALLASAFAFGIVSMWTSGPSGRVLPPRRLYASLLATSLFATWSHVVLDGIMHRDARPLWPVTDSNPLLSLIRVGTLHRACLALGFFGLIIFAFRWPTRGQEP